MTEGGCITRSLSAVASHKVQVWGLKNCANTTPAVTRIQVIRRSFWSRQTPSRRHITAAPLLPGSRSVFELRVDTPTHCTQDTSFMRRRLLQGGKVELSAGAGSHSRCVCSACVRLHHRCSSASPTLGLRRLISAAHRGLNIYKGWSDIVSRMTQSFVGFSYSVVLPADVCVNVSCLTLYKPNVNQELSTRFFCIETVPTKQGLMTGLNSCSK